MYNNKKFIKATLGLGLSFVIVPVFSFWTDYQLSFRDCVNEHKQHLAFNSVPDYTKYDQTSYAAIHGYIIVDNNWPV